MTYRYIPLQGVSFEDIMQKVNKYVQNSEINRLFSVIESKSVWYAVIEAKHN